MIFNDLLQRKLTSILRPWLAHEPQLELKLGFFQSIVVAKNLNFDASALNNLIDDDNQDLRLLFRSVTVDEVIIRVANWRFPAFTIEFSGVNVTLFLEKRFVRKVDVSVDDYLEARKKKILAKIDSVGSTLHDNIEKMMMIASSKRHIKDSITNLILMHSCLHLYDVRIRVEYPVSDDIFSWICFSKEFNAQSSYKGLGSLLGGFISSFFRPLRETSFILETSKIEIGSVKKDHSSCILSCVNPYFDIRMKDLLVVKSYLSVSEMNFSFSPTQIQMMGAFNNLLNIECKHIRSGRLLWGIVRWKIHHSLLLSRCMLYNVTLIAVLWLRLVKEYHYFLILVGYSEHGVKMPKGSNRPRLAVQQWKMLSQIIEKELPTQAVASARRVARCRAALEKPHAEVIGVSQMSSDPSSFQKIILWLAFIWQETVKIFAIIMSVFLLLKKLPVDQHRTISEVADPVSCFHLSFGKVSAVVSLKDGSCPPVHKSSKLRNINSYIDRKGLFLVVKGLLFIYEEGISEQYISFTLGFLKVTSAPVDLENETRPKNVRGSMKEGLDGSETIVWGESALMCCHSGEIGHEDLPVLEQFSAEMELILKKMQLKFQRSKGNYEDKPWAFCAIHTFWVYPGLESPDSGLLKCDLAAGKLNVALGYSSAASIATLWEQIQHALGQDDGSESAVVTRQSSRTLEKSRETNWSVGLKTSIKAMKMPILKYLPNKHFEVRAIIAGPRVGISMRNDEISISKLEHNATYGQDGINLTIDVHNIEFAIWPTEKSGVSLHEEHQQLNFEPVFCKLEEPAIEKLSGSVNLRYAAKGRVTQCYYLRLGGLKVYFEDMVDNHLMQVLSLKPMTAKLSSLRDYVNSFARTIIASSLSLCGATSGVTGSFFMDELSMIMLVVESMLFVAPTKPAYGYSRLHAAQNYAVISEDQFLQTEPLDQEILIAAEDEAALIPESSFCSVSASFELAPFDIILHNTRNRTDRKYFSTLFDGYNIQYLSLPELPDTGIWLTIQKICIEAFVGEAKVEANAKFQDFQAIMLRYKNQNGNADELEDAEGVDCLHEISFCNCTINLLLDFLNGSRVNYGAVNETSVRSLKALRTFPSSITGIEGFDSKNIQDEDTESNVPVSMPDFLLLLNAMVDKIFVGPCSIKSGISWGNPSHKLHLSLSVEGDFQGIAFGIQGGRIIIESTVPARISLCVTLYFQFIKSLLIMDFQLKKSRERPNGGSNMFAKENYEESAQTKKPVASSVKQELLQALSVNVSELSLVLLVVDESRVVKEIIGRVDFIVKLWLENQKKKFLVNLSHLNILSLIQSNGMVQSERYVRLPHFSSVGSSYHSLRLNSEVSSGVVPEEEKTSALSNGASSSNPIASSESSFANGASSSVSQSSERQGNYILEQLTAAISAEKPLSGDNDGPYCPTQGWVGNGSVSGLNLTVSVSEIQILMAIIESMSEVSAKGVTKDLEEKSWASLYRESEKDAEAALPDGAIVAIQDVHQHLYIAIESEENKYKLGSTVHYTLAGKRALFRVKWQKRRVWDFSAACFSLMSLYAKSDSGSPLCLNYSGSSDFVDLSGNDGSARALWKIASCKHELYEDDVVLDPLNHLFKSTYFLVNKKNDCGAAFVNGALEFVKKPGNPFKFRIFHGLLLAPDLRMPETHLPEPHDIAYLDGQDITKEAGMVPCISLTFEKVSLIIVHELSDPKDKLPLLQGSVDGTELKIQILPQKIRVMSTLSAMLYFFDVHRVIWREFVQPIVISIYWRSTTALQTTEISNHGMRSRLHFRIQELDLSITELLLDILLYVVGKLDLAGPFAVNNSAVLGNCCKVENQLDLDLICHFPGNQSARVGRRQSAFFFLRHLDPEASHTTIMLDNPGISSTSSVHVPLSRTQFFAWRTQIISQDSQTFPGPFIVFDISKNAEEGLSLDVSPLLKIHNNTGFSVELRIQRPESAAESASVVLRVGETVDDCMASFDAISLSGGPKKALLSLGVGNFMFSFRPEIKEEIDFCKPCSFGWSENLKGEKAVRLSGVIDKLSYQVRKAFSAKSWTYSFSTAGCSVISGDTQVAQMYFLVQRIARDVPIMQINDHQKSKSIALQEQKEIFLLPTVRITNLLESDIDVLLTETEISTIDGFKSINQAIIQHGSTVDLYANPAVIYFNITLSRFSSSCKPVNCSHWLKKLNKKKEGLQFLDIDLDFCGGMYFACLRLARGNRGMLEAIVFTQYTLKNDTDFPLFCAAPHLKPLSRDEAERHAITTPPHFGTLLPPQLTRSWFMKSSKLCIKLLDEESSKSILDLDALSGLAEVRFTKPLGSGMKDLIKLGISLGPVKSEIDVPARMVTLVPRFIISNESDEQVFVRQCFSKDDFGETITISSKQRKALIFRVGSHDERDISVFDKILKKHKASEDDTSIFVQFSPNETLEGWSGPICVASLGCFFLKFKRHVESPAHQLDLVTRADEPSWEFAAVHVVEEGSTFVLHFRRPPDSCPPYRIENHLSDASITYYQKDTFQPETLRSGGSVSYVWDDSTRPHKLIVKINGTHMQREISLDKLRPWKSFYRAHKERDLASPLPLNARVLDQRGTNLAQMNGIDVQNVGYEVCVDGPARVLRISHSSNGRRADNKYQSCQKIQLRISYFAIRLLEPCKQFQDQPGDVDPYDLSTYTPIIIGRLENVCVDSIIIDQRKYNQIRAQSLHVDVKWVGAPFAAMLRRHLTSNTFTDDSILFVIFVLFPTTSDIRDVRYSSIILQPIDLNLDEETLMKIVPFWRTSLSSNTQSQQYYFDHFEIHPVKITASFLPEDSPSNYSSGQEALRSLLHSVIKIPAIKNLEVELNGVLISHALVTTRELLLRCARHYSWYGMRAIYIAKGSPLLPPTFASVFDDLASSSLDVFFDPSSSLFNVQGLTLGTFKLIRKCVEDKGFSGTKRYFGDLSKTLRNAGSNVLFAAVTEVSDSVLKGAESSGFNGMMIGFHHGILRLAMEPSLLGTALLEGGSDRRIKLDRSPGIDELYVEGYLQAMLDTIYKQEYLRVRVIDDQVILKNLPPNSSLIDEIMERVKDFLVSKSLLKGDFSSSSRSLRHLRGEKEWRIGPTLLTLCEHLFVSFAIRMLRKQTDNALGKLRIREKLPFRHEATEPSSSDSSEDATSKKSKGKFVWRRGIGRFALSAMVAYVDGRLCRYIPNPVARRIVSGFLLSFLDNNSSK